MSYMKHIGQLLVLVDPNQVVGLVSQKVGSDMRGFTVSA